MSKLNRLWDRLQPGLISLYPMGSIVWFDFEVERETLHHKSKGPRSAERVSDAKTAAVVIAIAQL